MFTTLHANSLGGFQFGATKESLKESLFDKVMRAYGNFDILEVIPFTRIEQNIDKIYDKANHMNTLWDTFIIADSLVYVFATLFAIFFILLAYLFRKNAKYYKLLVMLAIISYPVVVISAKLLIANIARSSELVDFNIKTFKYSGNIYLSGKLGNTGRYEYKQCNINIVFFKKTNRAPKDIVNSIKPLKVLDIKINELKINEFREFASTVYTIPKDMNFTTQMQIKCK